MRGLAASAMTRACSQLMSPRSSASAVPCSERRSFLATFTRDRATPAGSAASLASHWLVDSPTSRSHVPRASNSANIRASTASSSRRRAITSRTPAINSSSVSDRTSLESHRVEHTFVSYEPALTLSARAGSPHRAAPAGPAGGSGFGTRARSSTRGGSRRPHRTRALRRWQGGRPSARAVRGQHRCSGGSRVRTRSVRGRLDRPGAGLGR